MGDASSHEDDLEPERHICVETFVKISGASSSEQVADRLSPRSLQRITERLDRALSLTINSGGRDPPASQCRLCKMAVKINEVIEEVECLSMSENLCCFMIICIMTFFLCLLQPGYRPVESSIQEIEDALALEILEAQRVKKRKMRREQKMQRKKRRVVSVGTSMQDILSPSPLHTPSESDSNMFSNVHDSAFDWNIRP
ncbi:hypothetical protein F5887DRAFT_998908 [Amanita rubescens]|nr:hypothetical protein F5887DRAFT_998908 [Amanita rubescens]